MRGVPVRVSHGPGIAVTIVMAAVACGGNTSDETGGTGGSTAGAGAPSSGATSNGGAGGTATPPRGGASSGNAGAAGSAGSPDCSLIDCASIECQPGTESIVLPGDCCPTCVPIDCSTVRCPAPSCPAGMQPEVPPDQCCPVCVNGPDAAAVCEAGRQNLMSALVSNLGDVFACSTDTDCTVTSLDSLCRGDCGTAVNERAEAAARSFVQMYGEDNCSTCEQEPVPCLTVVLTAVCVAGSCETQ